MSTLLSIEGLEIGFALRNGVAAAVRGIDLAIAPGTAIALVGESGSGKTLTALSILRLLPPGARVTKGRIAVCGSDLLTLDEQAMRGVRGRVVSMVFQDPMSSLNPAFTIGQQMIDVICAHRNVGRRQAAESAIETLDRVGILTPNQRMHSYPHELSGGMRQRVLMAMAISCGPKLLIADEPTTALDVTVQAQLIKLLGKLRDDLNLAILFITHNLDLVSDFCDYVAVMYAGQIVETAPVDELFSDPRHPYTRQLLRCIPRIDSGDAGPLPSIGGRPPRLGETISGCAFAPRCQSAITRCHREEPHFAGSAAQGVRCWVVQVAGVGTD